MGLNGIPDFTVLVNMDGNQAFVTFPLVEANVHFGAMQDHRANWTVVDGPGQWENPQ